jgi:pyrroloquinoline quinone biosynthesis protein D
MLPPVELDARPRLARGARLRFDRVSGQHLLLSPERGLLLNETAAEIVFACRGSRTVAQIVSELSVSVRHNSEIGRDVVQFLDELRRRRLIELLPSP